MSIEMCVLGSGSSGNSTLVRINGRAMLIDAGFGPRTTAKRLEGTGVSIADLSCILLTHLDQDHFAPTWHATLLKHKIKLYCWRKHLYHLYNRPSEGGGGPDARLLHMHGLLEAIEGEPFTLELGEGATAKVRPIELSHDQTGSLGYVVSGQRMRLGYATDLGRVPKGLIEAFADLDYLAIESNYDVGMQRESARPQMLKDRIMGGRGHLSNEQSFEAICRILERSARGPAHVVLLHLSRQCNDPALVQRLFEGHPWIKPRLCITCQGRRTHWLGADGKRTPLPGEQMVMF